MRRWDIQDGNWQAELAGREQQEMGHPRWNWQIGRRKRNLPQEMGHPRWELAGREMRRGIYHMTWDFKAVMGLPSRIWQVGRKHVPQRWELPSREMGTGI